MRVLVCGGRDFTESVLLDRALDRFSPTVIIEGCARGADHLAELYARKAQVAVEHYPADWARDGRAAGPIRNRRMLVEGQPDLVVAFPGGRGTANMIEQAEAAGVKVVRVSL